MGSYEATNVVLSKVKSFEPENASKIMGYLLMNLEEYELVRLACCPDHVLHTLVLRVKTLLGMALSTPSSPSPLNPICRMSSSSSINPFSKSSPRGVVNGFEFSSRNPPSSPCNNVWQQPSFQNNSISPKFSPLLSFESIHQGGGSGSGGGGGGGGGSGSSSLSPRVNVNVDNGDCDFVDEQQLNEYFPFLNNNVEDLVDPRVEMNLEGQNWISGNNGDTHNIHRRSYSANDASFGCEESGLGFGFKPCLYFARGFCKNGSNCKFVHGDSIDASSLSKFEGLEQQHEEFMRFKAAQHQRLVAASQLAAGGTSPSSYDKYLEFLMQQHNDNQRAAAAFMMGEEYYNISGRGRPERNEFLAMVSGDKPNSASRQIYLTFPAESTFKDEDVSEYFSKFGPVQDVRIPYQQKRMFGFVTFVFPETVRIILSKGNPHFICDSRVLVKPYKEKGKVLDKRQHQQQQLERGDFSPCLSPSSFDPKEPFDFHPGTRMLHNPHDILLRRKMEEQAELQQVLEFQERRLKNLQLPDFKNNPMHLHQRSLSVGTPLGFPHQLHAHVNHAALSPDNIQGDITGFCGSRTSAVSLGAASEQQLQQTLKEAGPSFIAAAESGNTQDIAKSEATDLGTRNVEQTLPDSLFASPTKAAGEHLSDFSPLEEANENTAFSTSSAQKLKSTTTASGDMASL